jgi:hypothetical protein
MGIPLLILALAAPAQAAEPSPCERITAEFREMESLRPQSCEEAKALHRQYQAAYAEINQQCRRLQARVEVGPPKLKLGTEDEMRVEASSIRLADLEERATLTQRITQELLATPIDTESSGRGMPVKVADACRDELHAYGKIRNVVLSSFSRVFKRIEGQHDPLFLQATERALPSRATAGVPEPGR